MKLIIFGSTGMVGKATLIEALENDEITQVLTVGRRSAGLTHPKLKEVFHSDFLDFSSIENELSGYDGCIYALGVTAAGLSDEKYRKITVDFTRAAAKSLVEANPDGNMRICYVSAEGTSEEGSTMWQRVKAEGENAIQIEGFKSAHSFRPAGIFPRKGVKTQVTGYRIMYSLIGWTYPFFKAVLSDHVTTSDRLGRALIRVAKEGHEKKIIEGADLVAIKT